MGKYSALPGKFLHTPILDLRDIQGAIRIYGHVMRKVEFTRRFPESSQSTKNLAIHVQFDYPVV